MKKLSYLVLVLGLAAGCHDGDRTSDKAADEVVAKQKALDTQVDKDAKRADETHAKADALAHANARFNDRKEIRLMELRSEQSMIAPQGDQHDVNIRLSRIGNDRRRRVRLDAGAAVPGV